MTVKVSKPSINIREELSDLKKPSGTAGEAMLRAETPQEQFNLIGAGRRNLIINGAMAVAQRGTSSTSTGYQTVDRFRMATNATDELAITQSQDSNAPDGFAESYKVEITTPESSFTTTEWFYLRHTIEGQNAQRLKFGTSSASQTTLSFWVKSSVTGTYAVLFFNDQGSGRGQTLTYTITSANTWEYKTIVFDGDTAQNFANSNAAGPDLYFTLSAGPDRKTADGSSWRNYSSQQSAYGQTADVGGTASATWQITGVQLELGKVATPFEHRSYGEELALCQRYFSIPINNVDEDGNSNTHSAIGVGRGAGGGAVVVWGLHCPVPMRDRPDITSSGSYYITDSNSRTSATPTAVTISSFTVNGNILLANYTFSSTVCDDDRVNMVGAHTAVKITLDAEL